jgi:hypothetical protein
MRASTVRLLRRLARVVPAVAATVTVMLAAAGGLDDARARAQVVSGTVVTRDTVAVSGAVVALIDSASTSFATTLTDEFGDFTLRAPRAGTWRLRVERVGFVRVTSLPFALRGGDEIDRRVHLRDATVRIAAIEVRDRARCEVRPAEGTLVATLWDEARKALAASIAQGGTPTLLDLDTDEVEYDADFRRVLSAARATTSGRVAQSFHSAPPASLRALGYVRVVDTTTVYYGPDARALLSADFAATHCLSLAGDDPRSIRLIGIGFAPVDRPEGLVDVAGTIWLDRETYELDRVEFRFAPALAAEQDDTTFGGRVQFARIPGGQVIVRRWELRMPVFVPAPERRTAPEGATSRMIVRAAPREVVGGLKVARGAARLPGEMPLPLPRVVEGRAREAATRTCAADSLRAVGEGWVTGVARDARGRPARDATVRISWHRGSTIGARTTFREEWIEVAADAQGRFALCGVPTGTQLLLAARQRDGVRMRERLRLERAEALHREVALGAQDLMPPAGAHATLGGQVVGPDGAPVPRALLTLHPSGERTTTGADGRFRFERVAPGFVDLHTRRLGHVPSFARLSLAPADTLDLRYVLDQTAQSLATVTVEATRTSMNVRGFELRRAESSGSAQFIGPEQLERRLASTIIAVLRAFTRVTVETSPVTGDARAYARGAGLTPGGTEASVCAMRLMIDGALLPAEAPLDVVPPVPDLAGIEVYAGAGSVPPQFSVGNKCGLIVLWTRDGIDR